jgi:hypothetical protein
VLAWRHQTPRGRILAAGDDLTKEVTPVLTTNLRTTQSLDPTTGVARSAGMTCVRHRSVTAATYQNLTTRSFATATGATAGSSFVAAWSFIERKPMPKVDLHPDRWPLQSTS